MVQAIREQVTVEKEGSIEIRHPKLLAGSRAEVIVLVEQQDDDSAPSPEEPTPIWEVAAGLGREIPDELWSGVPTDLARNLDHYLYGAERDDE